MRRFLRFCLGFSAIAYPLLVAAIALALGIIGERWWPTTIGLYVPRILFAAPLPFVVLALLVWGPRWLLLLQVGAAAVIVFPLMGLSLGRPAAASGPTVTVLSYNVDFNFADRTEVVAQIVAKNPDVVALQAVDRRLLPKLTAALPAGRHERSAGEFFISSKYPIASAYEPPPLGDEVSAAFVRVTISAPFGPVDLYVTHPWSPRRGFEAIRDSGLQNGLATGESFSTERTRKVTNNTEVRVRQVEALAAHARTATHPVIIAGDTNLPTLSPLFRRELGGYQDGWSEVGTGFGYSFPAHKWMPWLRIDRILAGRGLRFVDFSVGERHGSDHLCVTATLTAGD